MTQETINFPRETTMQRIASALEQQAAAVRILAKDSLIAIKSDWKAIQDLVRQGLGPSVFNIGDQFIDEWVDVDANNAKYSITWDITHFGPVTLKDGETVPGMYLQMHYAMPWDLQFDNYEAMTYAEAEMPAGTYTFKIAATWSKALAGDYKFTLTKPVPAGGQIAGLQRLADNDPSTWKISTYANGENQTAIETVSVTAGAAGTSLGTMTTAGGDIINSIHRIGYGYNRYSHSNLRLWLNAKGKKWWKSQNKYDRAPGYNDSRSGLLSGFSDEFLAVLAETKQAVSTNTVADGGVTDYVYDKIFLPSLEQEYFTPYNSGSAGVEGEYWEYHKRAKGLESPQPLGGSYTNVGAIRYRVNNHTSAVYMWLRSCYRSYGFNQYYVGPSGCAYYNLASSSHAVAPACVIA